jgi:hypothetical protein
MKAPTKAALITVGVAVPAMGAGPALFPLSPDWPAPAGAQVPLLAGVIAAEAVALGLAVAFLILGRPVVRKVVGPARRRTVAAYFATAWLLGNWWLHDGLHAANGVDMGGLIAIEYAFHTTLMVAGAIVGWQLLRSLQGTSRSEGDPGSRPVGGVPEGRSTRGSDPVGTPT